MPIPNFGSPCCRDRICHCENILLLGCFSVMSDSEFGAHLLILRSCAAEPTICHSPSPSSSSGSSSGSIPWAASDGKMRGNHPYSVKSIINSPSGPVVTVTPSASSAAAWFLEPDGWDLCKLVSLCISMMLGKKSVLPGRDNSLGIDNTLPWYIVMVKA